MSQDEKFLADWQRDSHDLVHVLADYRTDILGETQVLALIAKQTRSKAFWSLVIAGFLCLVARGQLRLGHIRHAVRRGGRAVHIPTLDWTEFLDRPLAEVREKTRIGCADPGRSRGRVRARAVVASLLVAGVANVSSAVTPTRAVSALGRIEPRDGIYEVVGPSTGSAVIAELRVEEGDLVEQGDVLAILDDRALHQADVQRIRAELESAERELERVGKLSRGGVTTDARRDSADLAVKVASADLARASAMLAMSIVRSPIDGQILKIHARSGERVGVAGIVEMGRTDEMVAVAEVYETDVGRVALGQRARITSPALPGVLVGEVERVGLKVGRLDLLDTDPAARTDARVVEVLIRLEDGAVVSGLTNLQVKIEIAP